MPLLHRKPFIRQQPPPDLDPTERLFYCRVTNEIFRDYDEFFERTILCNSLVWSCYFTGKSGLTYQEALESEKKIRKNLQNFPDSLIVPLLYISSISSRQRIQDLCDDIYAYVKNRFFVGEIVDVVRNSGARLECRILDVKAPPQQNGMANGHKVDGDTIIISDSDDETPKDEAPVRKKEPLDPTLFRYKVEPVKKEMYESVIVRSYQISRNTSLFSQERLKLFLKLHTETQDGMIKLKANSRSKYNLLEKNFFNYFPDEPPRFHQSPANIRQTGRSLTNKHLNQGNGLSSKQNQIEAARERERILKHRKELKEIEMKRAMMRKQQAETAILRRKEYEDKERQKEFFKKFVEVERIKKKEEKERIKLEKEKEREKIREEKRKYAERLKLWSKPRDDMECDDLQELPEPIPVKTRLSPECFGDALMILEFLYAFGALFDLRDEFPEGVTLEILEEALVGSDPEGPLCELIFFFLSAIFQAMAEEEEEVAKDQITDTEAKDLTEALDEDQDTTKSALLAVASLAAAWPQLHQGCSLKDLNLDSCTVSEILRLHILASGADVNNVNAKYRYQKQGGFDASDDPCMELRLNHPAILKKLSNTSVYALPPGEKLKLLHALCGKLLTLVTTRDFIEDYMEELRQTKQEFRELKAEQNKREREEAATRIRKRREEKLKEQELRMKDKQEKLKEDENSFDKSAGNEELDDLDTSSETKDAEQKDQDTASEDESTSLNKIGKEAKIHIGIQDMKKKNQPSEGSTEKKEPLTANEETFRKEQQKREQELLLKIQEATACTNIFPLGRDRWYRRYWSFYSVPGLFVEEDYSGLTEDMLQPQPISQRDSSINSALNCNESSTSSVQENKEELEIRKPVNKPNRWCYFSASEQVDKLIEALNTRGHRESSLKEVLLQEKNKICQKLSNISSNRFSISDDVPPQDVKPVRGKSQISPDPVKASAEKQLELRLCDLLLDIEERIYQGTLGAIKVLDRQSWRTALEKCCYEFLFDETKENGAMKHVNQGIEEMDIDSVQKQNIKERLHGLKTDVSASSTNTNTPQSVTNTVHYLARALHQIEQGVERKYLKYPLGDADDCKRDPKSEKKKKEDRKKKDEDQSTERDDVSDSGRVQRTVLDRWRESLLSSGSLSQIFLHLSTLDRSIMWSRSIRNARCKVCRKKGDGENMLLCDGCDRGHHIYCVRPKLKFVPEGDWFCPECKPKQRSQRQLPKQRPSKDYEDEELEAEELEEEQEQGDTEEETVMSEEESVLKKGRTKVKLPLKTKGGKKSGKTGHKKGEGKTPKNQQSTPKNILTALKSGATTTGRKTQSAPSMGNKSMSHLSNFNSPSSHETSLVELVSHQVKGRGRGKALKSLDNTPESSPFAFRPFSLNIFEMAPLGRRSQPQTSQHDPGDSKGKSKKRVSADISSVEQGSRRSSGRHYGVHEISACEQLVVELVRHDDSWPFMKVVSKLQVPDYFDIIKKPIALNVIREKVNNCEYKSASEFIEDIELMFSNCFEYNHINSNEAKASYAEFIEDIELMFSNCFEYNHINSNEAKAGFRLQSFFICEAKKLGLEVSTSKNIVPPLSKKSRL